jgi:bacteriorhodopsin
VIFAITLLAITQYFGMVFGWAQEEVEGRVKGSVQVIFFFRFDLFLQHPPKILLIVSTREFPRFAGVPASSWWDGSCI